MAKEHPSDHKEVFGFFALKICFLIRGHVTVKNQKKVRYIIIWIDGLRRHFPQWQMTSIFFGFNPFSSCCWFLRIRVKLRSSQFWWVPLHFSQRKIRRDEISGFARFSLYLRQFNQSHACWLIYHLPFEAVKFDHARMKFARKPQDFRPVHLYPIWPLSFIVFRYGWWGSWKHWRGRILGFSHSSFDAKDEVTPPTKTEDELRRKRGSKKWRILSESENERTGKMKTARLREGRGNSTQL